MDSIFNEVALFLVLKCWFALGIGVLLQLALHFVGLIIGWTPPITPKWYHITMRWPDWRTEEFWQEIFYVFMVIIMLYTTHTNPIMQSFNDIMWDENSVVMWIVMITGIICEFVPWIEQRTNPIFNKKLVWVGLYIIFMFIAH